jgi:hypothetical protein
MSKRVQGCFMVPKDHARSLLRVVHEMRQAGLVTRGAGGRRAGGAALTRRARGQSRARGAGLLRALGRLAHRGRGAVLGGARSARLAAVSARADGVARQVSVDLGQHLEEVLALAILAGDSLVLDNQLSNLLGSGLLQLLTCRQSRLLGLHRSAALEAGSAQQSIAVDLRQRKNGLGGGHGLRLRSGGSSLGGSRRGRLLCRARATAAERRAPLPEALCGRARGIDVHVSRHLSTIGGDVEDGRNRARRECGGDNLEERHIVLAGNKNRRSKMAGESSVCQSLSHFRLSLRGPRV